MLPGTFPVFPLQTVCFPGHRIPLRIFEPRYLQMLKDIAEAPAFVIALISSGKEVGEAATPYRVGTLVDFDEVTEEGVTQFIAPVGRVRVEIKRFDRSSQPYLLAECVAYQDEPENPVDKGRMERLRDQLWAAAKKHASGTEDGVDSIFKRARKQFNDENYSLFLCGCLTMPTIYQQRLLEMRHGPNRLDNANNLLSKAFKGRQGSKDSNTDEGGV